MLLRARMRMRIRARRWGHMSALTCMLACVLTCMRACARFSVSLPSRVSVLPSSRELTPPSLQGYGQTPLYVSARKGHTAVVEALVAGGAEVDKANVRVSRCLAVPPSLCLSLSLGSGLCLSLSLSLSGI